jgi:mannose-6-phosphate isomerase-like protein (cupin superfamily)
VESWDLMEIETPGGTLSPHVLFSDDSRAVLLRLAPGQELVEHQVRERAFVCVVEGSVTIRCGEAVVDGGVGTLVTFDPGERHSVRSAGGARLLLLLAPWPAPDHYGPLETVAGAGTSDS